MKNIYQKKRRNRLLPVLGKKGVLADVLYIVVFLFVALICFVVIHNFWNSINNQLVSSNAFGNTTVSRSALVSGTGYINGLDQIFVMAVVLLFLGMVISAFFLDTHPILFFLTLTLLLAIIVLGAILSNTMNTFEASPGFANESATFTMGFYIFDNYPLFIGILLFVATILFYAKVVR